MENQWGRLTAYHKHIIDHAPFARVSINYSCNSHRYNNAHTKKYKKSHKTMDVYKCLYVYVLSIAQA